jgi:hypothetical protein
MGCLITILMFLLFPFLYMWYMVRKGMNRMDDIYRNTDREKHEENHKNSDYSDSYNNTNASASGKKKHVFKQDEGEYVDFKEI